MNNFKFHIVLFLALACMVQSCSIKKFIPEGERISTGAEIVLIADTIINNEANLMIELEETLRPKPNKKVLGGYIGLYYFYKTQKEKPGFFNKWMYKQIGEKPVYQSQVKQYDIEKLILNRLENRGYFYSAVSSEFTENDKKKEASFTYIANLSRPYIMQTYQMDTLAPPIYAEMQRNLDNSSYLPPMQFDLSKMKVERERIDADIKSRGYYNFNPGFIIFEADTNQYDSKKFDLFIKLKKDVPRKAIIPYTINNIYVYPNNDLLADSVITDTTRFNKLNFIGGTNFFKPKFLSPFVTLQEGELYDPIKSKNTARRLSTIGAYKFVNIQYVERDTSAAGNGGNLDAYIYLSPLNKRAIRAEIQALSKSSNFAGPAVALTYSNRNLFKGGEVLSLGANFGYEFQIGGTGTSNFNTGIGLKSELIFPRVIFPIKINTDFFIHDIPKTKTSLAIDYSNRSQLYTLLSFTAQFGYDWNAASYVTHEIIPISINYNSLSATTATFDSILVANPVLKQSFDQQFISSLNYSFTYNELVNTAKRHTFYFNSTFDIAGNLLSLLDTQPKIEGEANTFFKQEYAQYAKLDGDIRYHFNFKKDHKIAARLFAGYGIPYGNSDVMPFTKQYFSGGPYSVRAFNIRSLGPGIYASATDANSNFFEQSGNIRLEANLEYRFPIFSYFKGAAFVDAGNVWNSKENLDLPGGKFSSTFLNELGMGAGLGLRIDVQGFVIRFDFAAPFQIPYLPKGERFGFKVKETTFNFGIGYPF